MPSKIGPKFPSSNSPDQPVNEGLKELTVKVTKQSDKKSLLDSVKKPLQGRVHMAPTSHLSKKFKKIVEETHR